MSDVARINSDIINTEDIDWPALWREFGFDTPDAAGCVYASRTQLTAAVESSDQNIAGDAGDHINTAVETGVLKRVTKADEKGTEHLVGYLCPEVYDQDSGGES